MMKLARLLHWLLVRPVRFLSSWAWAHERGAIEGFALLKSMKMDDRTLDMAIQTQPEMAQYVGKCFAAMVANSPNYTEMQFTVNEKYHGKWEHLTVTIQKFNGKTPHQLKVEAEQERDRYKALYENKHQQY